ncbi:MAG: pantoate--beta-alanine ligase [Myxococcaceae bacterium]
MKIIQSPREMQDWSLGCSQSIGFVCTMGALHEGHLSLIREARKRCEKVVMSIFVNPLQFAPHEDFNAYPRTFESDVALCRAEGVDILFCPEVSALYPENFQTRVLGSELKKQYCGQTRPIFFDGVLTVVHMLFEIVRPQMGFWGEKDFQQVFLVEQMVKDFWMPIEIIGMPIVREPSGLALSSRNAYLSEAQKQEATCLFQAILAVQEAALVGERSIQNLLGIARSKISLEIDYLELVSAKTLERLEGSLNGPARLLIAAYIGDNPKVRLIDNGNV